MLRVKPRLTRHPATRRRGVGRKGRQGDFVRTVEGFAADDIGRQVTEVGHARPCTDRYALVTHAVVLVDEDVPTRRNAAREHPAPSGVLAAQLHRFGPPYPGQAHRTWYIGASGTIEVEA